ncbi:MAG: patatin-like phospholipase family protein [Luteimonas sp.]
MAADAPRIRRDEKIALALGAGGARGLAQIGVIEALLARGLQIVAVSGSSSGALVGGIFAAGKLAEFHARLMDMDRSDFLRLLDPVIGRPALFRGDRLIETLADVVGNPDIETLPVDFTAVAVDLQRQREVWLRDGPLWTAIRASIAIPGLFTPHEVHGRELVDGGLLAPLPIAATRLSDAHRLIAVDMHGWPQRPPGAPAQETKASPETPSPGSRLGAWVEKQMGGRPDEAGMTELLARSLDTMQAQIARVQLALDPPELLIRIPRDACLFYEFWRAKELVAIGRIEADKALDAAGY